MYATVIPVWIGTGVLGSDVLGLHRLSACMLIFHKGHTDTIQVYSVTVLTHVKALQAGHSSQGTSEHITPGIIIHLGLRGPTPPGPTPFTINISPYQALRYHCANPYYRLVNLTVVHGSSVMAAVLVS